MRRVIDSEKDQRSKIKEWLPAKSLILNLCFLCHVDPFTSQHQFFDGDVGAFAVEAGTGVFDGAGIGEFPFLGDGGMVFVLEPE